MGFLNRYLAVPRPRTFLHFMSLRTGTEMIFLSVIFNKATGFFGLLSILTGISLSPLQLTMYIYSCAALIFVSLTMRHIKTGSPFENLALAYFYIIDTIVNTAFTSAFAITWFLAVSADEANEQVPNAPGSGTISDSAGFTSPKFNVSKVDVIAGTVGQDAVALVGAGTGAATVAGGVSIANGVGIEESIPSLLLVGIFTIIRIYFIFIVMAYARQVLRSHVYASANNPHKLQIHTSDHATDSPAENPFKEENPQGKGWKGKMGRMMVGVGESYWLGGQADDSWIKGLDGRFKSNRVVSGPPGTVERERRARSGTGPPAPPVGLGKV